MGKDVEYKRKYGRVKTPFLMHILSYNFTSLDSDHCTMAEGINISPTGISFKYPKVIERNDHIKVLIHSIRGLNREEIIANVRIVWIETKDELSRRFGGKFVKISAENKYKLMKYIRQNGGD